MGEVWGYGSVGVWLVLVVVLVVEFGGLSTTRTSHTPIPPCYGTSPPGAAGRLSSGGRLAVGAPGGAALPARISSSRKASNDWRSPTAASRARSRRAFTASSSSG